MVKTDAHMHKIKGRLLSEKKKIVEAEDRKKAREARKRAKEVQADKKRERVKQKEQIDSYKKWRKQRQQGGFAKGNDDGPDLNFETEEGLKQSKGKMPSVSPWDRSGGLAKRGKERTGGQEMLSLDMVVGKGLRSKILLRRRVISEALTRG
jgi:rRNA-processing protein EBP2